MDPTDAKEPASHVHEVNPAPRRSVGEVVKDVWTRDKFFGDWGGLRTDLSDCIQQYELDPLVVGVLRSLDQGRQSRGSELLQETPEFGGRGRDRTGL